jgi:hypothetical protein
MLTDDERRKLKRIETIERNLYEVMPGAEPVPTDEHGKLWGYVENTPHYEFCHAIANLIVRNSAATLVDAD